MLWTRLQTTMSHSIQYLFWKWKEAVDNWRSSLPLALSGCSTCCWAVPDLRCHVLLAGLDWVEFSYHLFKLLFSLYVFLTQAMYLWPSWLLVFCRSHSKILKLESREAQWPSAAGTAKATWPCKVTDIQLHRSSKPGQPHMGKTPNA